MGACCDSKPFGKPCGDCAFHNPDDAAGAWTSNTVIRAPLGSPLDPAVSALAWGARTGAAKSGLSGYWQAMLAADMYRKSGSRSPAVDHFVKHALSEDPTSGFAFFAAETTGDQGVPVITGDPQPPLDDGHNYVPTRGGGGNISTSGGGACCCCLEDVRITAAPGGYLQGTNRAVHQFQVEVTTSFKPSVTPKPCTFEWLEMPYVKGEDGEGYVSEWKVGGTARKLTVYRNRWNRVYSDAPDHPMFTKPMRDSAGRTLIDRTTGLPFTTIPTVLSTTKVPPNCPGPRTGYLRDEPGTSKRKKFSLYGVVSVRSGCPPVSASLVKAAGDSCASTRTCKNIDVPWWAYIDATKVPTEFVFWTPCMRGATAAGAQPTHAQYDPWTTPKGFGDFPGHSYPSSR